MKITDISKKRFYSNCLFAAIFIRIRLPNTHLCILSKKYEKYIDPVIKHGVEGPYSFHVVVIHSDPNTGRDSIIDFIPSVRKVRTVLLFKGHYRVLNNLGIDDLFTDLVKASIYYKKTKDEILNLVQKYEKKLKYTSAFGTVLRGDIPEELIPYFKEEISILKNGNII